LDKTFIFNKKEGGYEDDKPIESPEVQLKLSIIYEKETKIKMSLDEVYKL